MKSEKAATAVMALAVALGASSSSCSSSNGAGGAPSPPAAQSIFVVPASLDELAEAHFFDHPWPSDVRRDPGGAVHVKGLYNPFGEPIIKAYLDEVTGRIDGFSTIAYGYMRFAVDLDPKTIPTSPPDTLSPTSTVQIVDVDPASPEHGQRHLTETFWQQAEGNYWVKDTLAVGPALGYPLRPKTRYAIVVTRGVKATDGTPIAPSPDLQEVLGLVAPSSRTGAAHDLYAPAVADLAALGIATSAIAHLAVFTTNDPTAELFSIVDDVHAKVPAPTIAKDGPFKANPGDASGNYDVYEGWYGPSPNYQQGTPPYTSTGGDFAFDAAGHAVMQNTFDLRFTLVVPNATKCPMPTTGYPIALYAHGTGGNYRSIIDEGNSIGDALAGKCIASIGTDQIFHGAYPGAPDPNSANVTGQEEIDFFNFANPKAMRTNTRQSAIDVVQEARLFTDTKLTVPATLATTGKVISFDATKLLFVGHSQGGLNGPLFLAADGAARGGVLSGASSDVPITLLDKQSPTPSVAGLWKVALGLSRPDDALELNLFHPIMSFAQLVVDPIDPLPYLGYIARHPRAGFAAKSIFQTEGVSADGKGDTYAPPHGIEVGATAMGLPRQSPGIHAPVEAAWSGLADVTIGATGLQGNLANGAASGVLAQFVPAANSDGHFVIFDIPAAREQAAQFCRNLADDAKGRVPAPGK